MTDVQKRFIKSFVVTSVLKLTCEKRKIDFGSTRNGNFTQYSQFSFGLLCAVFFLRCILL